MKEKGLVMIMKEEAIALRAAEIAWAQLTPDAASAGYQALTEVLEACEAGKLGIMWRALRADHDRPA